MPLTLSIASDSITFKLPDTTIKRYKFDYSEADNYAKGNTEMLKLSITIDVMEILSLEGSMSERNIGLVQNLRDWSEYKYTETDSHKEYYRKVILKNEYCDEEVRTLYMSHAYVNKSVESFNPLKATHTIALELLQKGDELEYVE